MKQRRLMLPIVGVLLVGCATAESPTPLKVTYVSSTGFLIEAADRRVIIDGLLAGFDTKYYHLPSDSNEQLMRRAAAPFDEIDLIAVTHAHADHFDAEVAAAHMASNPTVTLVGPPQVDEKLQVTEAYSQIKDRVIIIPAPTDSVVELEFAEIRVKALPSEHAPFWDTDSLTGEKTNRHAWVQHLEYVIRLGDRVLYHCGDAPMNDTERYQGFGFGDTTIDLAMVDWWDAREQISFNQKLLRDIIRPERIIMMHMFPERPPRGQPDQQILVAPLVILPDSMMQRWVLD
jgi:L-ascorbate metabolism protein UlaG (beta-lactamase superfamily)